VVARLALSGSRSRQAFQFGLVGLSGLVVNQITLAGLTEGLGVYYLAASILATQVSSTWNFLATDRWVFGDRVSRRGRLRRFGGFLALNNATLLARIPLLWAFTEMAGVHYLWSNAITLGLMFLFRFAVADGWIWASGANGRGGDTSPAQAPGDPIRYSIAGILRIESDVALRELAHFRTLETGAPDLVIRVGRVGALPMTRTRFDDAPPSLRYLEHLGAASANFQIVMGEPITVRVAPLLANSPHVLYTNVIEALLRFLLVSRDHVLLHSACVMVDGHAVLLSAQTDTGKTSTVIRLVRDRAYKFLSDDMTIIAPDGVAIQYPKPMTMSYHTMSAISGHKLPWRQRAALAIQSRLHSKSGRTVGRRLGDMNIPIMSINSVVQWLVPPPKFHIDALLECDVVERAPIGHVFIMERGEAMQRRERPATAVPTLIENTDDAYGFPPFSTFAPRLRIGDDNYAALRAKEKRLLRRAIARAAVWRVRVPGHEWAEVLPELISRNGHAPASWQPSTKITQLRPIRIVTTVEADDPAPLEQVSV
jgi:dolichol-phosphate mannosyltransferase